jgi:hypothetical protein
LDERFFQVKLQSHVTDLHRIQSGVPQGSVLGPVLYLLFTADLPSTQYTTVGTFADDTAILASHDQPDQASHYLQQHLLLVETWLKKWRIRANETKSVHVTFTLRRKPATCPPVRLNNIQLVQQPDTKYLGIHLDSKLTWRKHISKKLEQLKLRTREMYWLIGRQSTLSLDNKLTVYTTILKPVWTYGASQPWPTSN